MTRNCGWLLGAVSGPWLTASKRTGAGEGVQSDNLKELNSANHSVSLKEDPELQNRTQPSQHLDFSL